MARLARIGLIGCGSHAIQNLYPSFRLARPEPARDGSRDRRAGRRRRDRRARRLLRPRRGSCARRCARDFGIGRGLHGPPRRCSSASASTASSSRCTRAFSRRSRVDCLEAGAHVFLEKPPAETLDDCLAMRDAAERGGRHVMVGFMKRFSEPYRAGAGDRRSRPDFGGVSSLRGALHVRRLSAARRLRLPERLRAATTSTSPAGSRARSPGSFAHPDRPGRGRPPGVASRARSSCRSSARPGATCGGWPRAGSRRRRRRGPACSASTSGAVGTLQLNCLDRLNERVVLTGRQSLGGRRRLAERRDRATPAASAPERGSRTTSCPGTPSTRAISTDSPARSATSSNASRDRTPSRGRRSTTESRPFASSWHSSAPRTAAVVELRRCDGHERPRRTTTASSASCTRASSRT